MYPIAAEGSFCRRGRGMEVDKPHDVAIAPSDLSTPCSG